jgi:hypothetical protein
VGRGAVGWGCGDGGSSLFFGFQAMKLLLQRRLE